MRNIFLIILSILLCAIDVRASSVSTGGGPSCSGVTDGLVYAALGGVCSFQSISGSGNVTGQSSSVDGEIALFSSTTGKIIKRATGSGIVSVSSGVYSAGKASAANGGTNADSSASTGIPHVSGGTWTFSTLSGSDLPSFTGDVTNSGAAMTVAKIAGVSVGTPSGSGNVVYSAGPTFTSYDLFSDGTNVYNQAPTWPGSATSCTTSATINFNSLKVETQELDLTASDTCVLTVSGVVAGGSYVIKVKDASSAVVTWPGAFDWGAAGSPTLSASGKYDDVHLLVQQSTSNIHAYISQGFSN